MRAGITPRKDTSKLARGSHGTDNRYVSHHCDSSDRHPHSYLLPVLICTRLLASTADVDIHGRVRTMLRESRNITFRWINELGMELDYLEDESSRSGLRQRKCMLAMTCFSTF